MYYLTTRSKGACHEEQEQTVVEHGDAHEFFYK